MTDKTKETETIRLTCDACMRIVKAEVKKGEKVGCWRCPDCNYKNCNN
ncbi:MAG: hypothetical protein ACOCQA_01890 [bacterium]